jgi:hypothetical protein
MKFSDLAAQLKGVEHADAGVQSAQALSELQEKYLFDISGAEFSCSGSTSGGSSTPPQFNSFCQWNSSF